MSKQEGLWVKPSPAIIGSGVLSQAIIDQAAPIRKSKKQAEKKLVDTVFNPAPLNLSASALKVSQDIDNLSLEPFTEVDENTMNVDEKPVESTIDHAVELEFAASERQINQDGFLDELPNEDEAALSQTSSAQSGSEYANSQDDVSMYNLGLQDITISNLTANQEGVINFANSGPLLANAMDDADSGGRVEANNALASELQRVKKELASLRKTMAEHGMPLPSPPSSSPPIQKENTNTDIESNDADDIIEEIEVIADDSATESPIFTGEQSAEMEMNSDTLADTTEAPAETAIEQIPDMPEIPLMTEDEEDEFAGIVSEEEFAMLNKNAEAVVRIEDEELRELTEYTSIAQITEQSPGSNNADPFLMEEIVDDFNSTEKTDSTDMQEGITAIEPMAEEAETPEIAAKTEVLDDIEEIAADEEIILIEDDEEAIMVEETAEIAAETEALDDIEEIAADEEIALVEEAVPMVEETAEIAAETEALDDIEEIAAIDKRSRGVNIVADTTSNGDVLELKKINGDELRTVIKYMDTLLDQLPESKIEEFAHSKYFDIYERMFQDLEIKNF